jgi:CSLREA domain-containing protein
LSSIFLTKGYLMNNHMKTPISFFRVFMVALLIANMMYAAMPVRIAHAATITVNNTGDGSDEDPLDGICEVTDLSNDCTLRAAIQEANYINDSDLIQFSGNLPITLGATPLPTISESLTIDGTGNTITIDATAVVGNGFTISADNVTIQSLELFGPGGHGIHMSGVSTVLIKDMLLYNGTGGTGDGINMSGVTGVTVQDSFIYDFPEYGIDVVGGSTGVLIDNNYIGIQSDGLTDDGNTLRGVRISSSPSNTISDNLISGNDAGGIQISGAASDGNTVTGNYIGTNAAGTAAVGNTGRGIQVSNAPNTQIGGSTAAERNLISGNSGGNYGIYVSGVDSDFTKIQGNYIGTDLLGEATIPNTSTGIRLNGTDNVTIGGNSSAEGNVISGNASSGIVIYNSADSNTVKNNIIGLDVDGDTDLGNTGVGLVINNSTNTTVSSNTISMNTSDGIRLNNGSSDNTIQSNRIGISQSGSIVLGNGANGVFIEDSMDNLIDSNTIAYNDDDGVNVTGATSLANTITNNSIFGNGNLGIDLVAAGPEVTINDGPLDADAGPNTLQNFPEFTAQIEGSGVRITGTFESGPFASRLNYDIQFFVNDACDGKGHGEGQTYIGGIDNLQLDVSDQATIDYLITPASVSEGQFITATATYDSGAGGLKDTSEFSPCAVVQAESSPGSSGVFVVNRLGNGGDGDLLDEVCEVTPGAGNCTLRAAIQQVNAGSAPPYTIAFQLPSPYTISPTSSLTPIYIPVIIDGTSQPGYSGAPIVMLDGASAGGGHGLRIYSDDVEVRGISIVDFNAGAGLFVTKTNVTIEDNYIGVETDGTTLDGNQTGIYFSNAGTNIISDNLISGNGDGIRLVGSSSSTNVIQGNEIGTNLGGTLDYGNTDDGISIEGGHDNQIGGTGAGQGNTISGNDGDGIEITGGSTGNLVYGNKIGTEGGGGGNLPNGFFGVNINGGSNSRVTNYNVIAYNGDSGVNVTNASSTGNLISESSIYSNGVLDIELTSGGNNSQAAPGLTQALQGASYTYVEGTLSAAPNTSYTIDLYSSPPNVPGPPVKTYRKSFSVVTDGAGTVNFSNSFPVVVAVLDQVFATARDSSNNTSQFSGSVLVVPGAPALTATHTYTPLPATNTNTPQNTSTPSKTPTKTNTAGPATNTSPPATNTPVNTNTPSGAIQTQTSASGTLTALAATDTPAGTSGAGTSTPWWVVPSDTPTDAASPTTDSAATDEGTGGGGLDTDTPVASATVTSEFGISAADETATAAALNVEGEGEGSGSNLSILLWVFIGLAVLFLFAGGAMELIRWLNSRRV